MVASISPPVLLPVLLPGSSLAPCLATCPLVTFEPLQLAASPFTVGRWDSLVLVLTGSTLLPTSVSNVGDGEDGEEGGGGGGREGLPRAPAAVGFKDPSNDFVGFPPDVDGGTAGFRGIPTDFEAVSASFEGLAAGLKALSSDLECTRADLAGDPAIFEEFSIDLEEEVKTGLEDTAGFGDPPGFERGLSGLEAVCGSDATGFFEGGCAGLEGGCAGLEGGCAGIEGGCAGIEGGCAGLEGGCVGLETARSGFGDTAGFEELSLAPNIFLLATGEEPFRPFCLELSASGDSDCFSADITSDMRTLMWSPTSSPTPVNTPSAAWCDGSVWSRETMLNVLGVAV